MAQAVGAWVGLEHDVAAAAAIAAIGTALGAELAAVEVGIAITALAGAGVNFDLIDEHWAAPVVATRGDGNRGLGVEGIGCQKQRRGPGWIRGVGRGLFQRPKEKNQLVLW